MDMVNLTWIYLSAFLCMRGVTGTPIGTSNINCIRSSAVWVGMVQDGYTGAVEVVNGIPPGTSVTLEPYAFPDHLSFLELNFTLGDTSAIVQTKKPLDADVLKENSGILHYSVKCQNGVDNLRTLEVIGDSDNRDFNFKHNPYHASIHENQIGQFDNILPEALKAQGGNGNNVAIVYSIRTVFPSEYENNFNIDASSGVISVETAIDRDELDSNIITVSIKAAQVKASDGGTPQRETFTIVTVSITDINDNKPVFSASIYTNSILVDDAMKGYTILMLSATDKDSGKNSLISYSFSEGASPYLALDSATGAVTLTSNLADVTEDTTLKLTAMAKDHGHPPLNSTAGVVIKLRINNVIEGVVFERSYYNFSLPENHPMGTAVGVVKASTRIDYDVTYTLKTHTDLFSIDASGALTAITTMDKETQDWYILEVEAVDTRVPPASAVALVIVLLEDVNEMPQFSSESYNVMILSIAPYKSPVIQVKATDPDIGDSGQLVYSLSAASDYFDIDHSTGQVFVVSVTALAGNVTALQVTATDPRGCFTTTKVEVEVLRSTTSDVVVISLNMHANIVENKVAEMEESLKNALSWTVKVVAISNNKPAPSEYQLSRESAKSFVSLIAVDGGNVISAEVVTRKLKDEYASVQAELVKVFGEGVIYVVEEIKKPLPTYKDAVIILMALMMLGALMALVIYKSKMKKVRRRRNSTKSVDKGLNFNTQNSNKSVDKGLNFNTQNSNKSVDKGLNFNTQNSTKSMENNLSRTDVVLQNKRKGTKQRGSMFSLFFDDG